MRGKLYWDLYKRPIFWPILGIYHVFRGVFYDFPLFLLGYWKCDECYKHQKPDVDRTFTQWGEICESCRENGVMRR